MKHMTLTEAEARQLKADDPLDYHDGHEWLSVWVVEPMRDDQDTVNITNGTWKREAELGELRQ